MEFPEGHTIFHGARAAAGGRKEKTNVAMAVS